MSIAISGTNGLLGSELSKVLKKSGQTVYDLARPNFDVTDPVSMAKFFFQYKPKIFINCAAYTDVPGSEVETNSANSVNNLAVGNLALLCASTKCHLIHFGTDFVFDGLNGKPYKETDPVNPLNYYGMSKLAGENSLKINMQNNNCDNYTIFRVQWMYGHNNKNFFQKILSAAKSKNPNPISLVSDEYGSPCSASFIARTLLHILQNNFLNKMKGELYHLTHDTSCSRFDCGNKFLQSYGINNVTAVSNILLGEIKRPKYSVLDNTKLRDLLKIDLGTWEDDLDNYILELKKIASHESWMSSLD